MTRMMKLTIYLVITVLCAFLFIFIPDFNWGGPRATSLFAQFAATNPWIIVKRVVVLSAFVFCSLAIMFGISSTPKTKAEENKPESQ